MTFIGLRVVRGPGWTSGTEDGGEGCVGTLSELDLTEVTVVWDNGTRKSYKGGRNNVYDLLIFDNAQICVEHPTVTCDGCGEDRIKGTRWKCGICQDFDLCSACYNQDKHDLSHYFLRFDKSSTSSVKVTPRQDIKKQKCQAKGIFKGATVTRGSYWRWEAQDGGEGSKGTVVDITDWEPSFRTKVEVKWSNGSSYNYRVGHKGKVDLKCVQPASGGCYYKSHLALVDVKDAVETDEESSEDESISFLARTLLHEHILRSLDAAVSEGIPDMLTAMREVVSSSEETIKPGLRVVRGPDWKWTDQDGGEGNVGTVSEVGSSEPETPRENCVVVTWDTGSRAVYRVGENNSYDLRVLDSRPTGVKHDSISCDSCHVTPLQGIRWKCVSCFNFDLCSSCYYHNEHDITHVFWRYANSTNKRFKVPRRCDSEQTLMKGIFVDAVVCRGPNWKWKDQDAGSVANGVVLSIKSWDATDTANSAAEVLWANEKTNTYRVGYQGNVDLKVVSSSSGGYYYPDHLPILGKYRQLHIQIFKKTTKTKTTHKYH
ncbi:E3 ubiquitin-protein ligase MIB2-like isoform X1 [Biomphalaria glabrata]